jgi:uncharacterized membrane protein SpoIIM required for sporulation
VIIDLPRFLAAERPYWDELEAMLTRLEDSRATLGLEEVRRLHYLFERSAADLARLTTFAAEPATRGYLESLVGTAYAWVHESNRTEHRFSFGRWLRAGFPETFRRRAAAFQVALLTTLAGVCFGALAVILDPGARDALMPFEGLRQAPAERVAEEEAQTGSSVEGMRGRFSAFLMTHNTRVAILALALGMTFGIGTMVLLFYNGVILGAVMADYLAAGQGLFLAAWLLPHGSVEIPAILISGQAGLVLGAALIGRGSGGTLRRRLRAIGPDLMTLVAGATLMLVWAGLVEAFLSQDHEPRLPYSLKILVGLAELTLLVAFLGWAGRSTMPAWLRWAKRKGEASG